jgi:DNA polymerase III epsilon subunit family exonuclease
MRPPTPLHPRQLIGETTFVALDLEATGVAFGHDRIIEIGAARFRVSREGHLTPGPTFHTLLNPERPLNRVIRELTGLSDGELAEAPRLPEVWAELVAFLEGTVIVGHQIRADLAWLSTECARHALTPLGGPFFCTLELSRRHVPDAPRHALGALVAHLGLAGSVHHRALSDALHTRNLFGRCVARAGVGELGALGLREPVPWPPPEAFEVEIPPHLADLAEAIASARRIAIRYRGGSHGTVWRPITPLGFFPSGGIPYLRGLCHLSSEARSFRCDRIRQWRPEADTPEPSP